MQSQPQTDSSSNLSAVREPNFLSYCEVADKGGILEMPVFVPVHSANLRALTFFRGAGM